MSATVYTVGHSTHSTDRFLNLLVRHGIQVVYDVRSMPYSRHNPQFNRETLRASLETTGIAYMFLGEQLGARSKNPAHYANGKVQYSALAASAEFKQGLECVIKGAETQRGALLCSEKDPINCHRAILICRHLRAREITALHILEGGALESTPEFETRLLRTLKLPEQDLFTTHAQMVERAYDLQSEKIAYSANGDQPKPQQRVSAGEDVFEMAQEETWL